MGTLYEHIERLVSAGARRLRTWIEHPFGSLYRWAIPLLVLASLCFALPAWVGLAVFLVPTCAFAAKTAHTIGRIHALDFIRIVHREGRDVLDTEPDRMQRAWSLGCGSLVGALTVALAVRAVLASLSGVDIPDAVITYLLFAAVLMGGFLLFYVLALRFDNALLRGLASVTVTLPVFFIIVAVVSILLSWLMRIVGALGLSAENMVTNGFSWLYDVQRILGMATDYFLQQDPLIIGMSIVLAALLLLLYTCTVPPYWMKSVTWWLKGLGLVAVVFSGAVIIFAGTWVADVQTWATESQSSQFAQGIDANVLSQQAQSLSGYQSNDLIALVKALVLPYTVGVFVANAALMLRKSEAKRKSDAILDGFAETGTIDETTLPELEKRYLSYGGNRTLWDIALRSIGHDVPLPHPFAPRALTLKERITGELEDTG